MFFFFLFSCSTFLSIFSSLDMIHIFKDVLCLILKAKKNVYVIMCYSFFHKCHFALNIKHNIRVAK